MNLIENITMYVHNPSDDIKKIIDSNIDIMIKNMSSIAIFNVISKIDDLASTDEENSEKYIHFKKVILEKMKEYDVKNYVVDETGRIKSVSKK